MIADFATLMVDPPRARCIGVEMKPYSLGHALILRRIGNRFVTGEFPLYEDLIAAAFVCAHSWAENQKLLRSPLRRWLLLKVWSLFAGKFNVAVQLAIMLAHIKTGEQFPEFRPVPKGAGRELYSEWDTRLFIYLKSLGYTNEEALDMPLERANLMFCAHLEVNGQVNLKSRAQYAKEEQMIKILEEEERKEGFAA